VKPLLCIAIFPIYVLCIAISPIYVLYIAIFLQVYPTVCIATMCHIFFIMCHIFFTMCYIFLYIFSMLCISIFFSVLCIAIFFLVCTMYYYISVTPSTFHYILSNDSYSSLYIIWLHYKGVATFFFGDISI
jgi:hypothetical protein